MNRILSCMLLALGAIGFAQAHFVFVTPDPGGATARVVMSENLTPDIGVAMIAGGKFSLLDAHGSSTSLTLTKAEPNFFTVALPGSGTRIVQGTTDLGVMARGQGKPHWLIYYPKALVGDAFHGRTLGGSVPVELVPVGKAGSFKLKLIARGQPLPDSEIAVILPNGDEKKVKTDANGESIAFTAEGRYGAWARFWEANPGERDGKKYEEVRNYATIVFDATPTVTTAVSAPVNLYTKLPEATSSFGSAESDGWLYVYGGHVSPTHSYFKEAVSGKFHRVSLKGEPKWESLPEGPPLQGMNLAAHKGKIYRVGGMAPRNEKGQPTDNHSTADVARYNPASRKWESLSPLPQTRSSHDVVVVDDKLIVIGGWALEGKGESWRNTIEILDLSKKNAAWTSQPQPFQRRALMAVALDGKVLAIGGMNDKSQVERKVSIYDPRSNQWSDGPELPAGAILGFAPAAGLHHGKIHVSLSDGSLMRLDTALGAWEKVAATSPRVAHRMASRGDAILLIGGAAKGKNLDAVETVVIEPVQRSSR